MALNPKNNKDSIFLAPLAQVYVAPAGTAVPTDAATELPAEFLNLGYTSEDGIEINIGVETEPINVHQSAVPVKFLVSSASAELKFTCMEWNERTVSLYFGTDWQPVDGKEGELALNLESTPRLSEKTLVVEWGDWRNGGDGKITGTKSRMVIPNGMVSEREGLTLARTSVQQLGVTIAALDDGSGSLGHVYQAGDSGGEVKPPEPGEPKATLAVKLDETDKKKVTATVNVTGAKAGEVTAVKVNFGTGAETEAATGSGLGPYTAEHTYEDAKEQTVIATATVKGQAVLSTEMKVTTAEASGSPSRK